MIPWRSTGDLMDRFQHEKNGLMERFFGPVAEGGNGQIAVWAPRVDIEETDKELVVKADLPGVDPKNVEVSARDGVLTRVKPWHAAATAGGWRRTC